MFAAYLAVEGMPDADRSAVAGCDRDQPPPLGGFYRGAADEGREQSQVDRLRDRHEIDHLQDVFRHRPDVRLDQAHQAGRDRRRPAPAPRAVAPDHVPGSPFLLDQMPQIQQIALR
ncbi:hypothetical protein [Mycolicibacterium chubuense]|uniref:hypothetical protein n=1 Tax=Mycolicibacterium chubuense TaxID=1800 RepID=UPI000684398A|nr:hypothetical protein [Mycolicibacterium chubuense]